MLHFVAALKFDGGGKDQALYLTNPIPKM